jgi:hypothetical protein
MNKLNVKQCFKMAKKVVQKKSPEILTGLGIAGMITTVVLAVKATPKALDLIDEEIDNQNRKLSQEAYDSGYSTVNQIDKLKPVETVKVAWKPYIPALLLGGASVGCLIGANTVSARRHAALYSAYELSKTAYNELNEKVTEVVGEKKVTEIKQKLAEDKVNKVSSEGAIEKKSNVVIAGDGDTWFIDAMSNQPFLSSKNKLDAAANELNRKMRSDMYVSLSQFYDEVGIEHTGTSDYIGWRIDKEYIDVVTSDAIVKDGKVYVVMDFLSRPEYGYDDLY